MSPNTVNFDKFVLNTHSVGSFEDDINVIKSIDTFEKMD